VKQMIIMSEKIVSRWFCMCISLATVKRPVLPCRQAMLQFQCVTCEQ